MYVHPRGQTGAGGVGRGPARQFLFERPRRISEGPPLRPVPPPKMDPPRSSHAPHQVQLGGLAPSARLALLIPDLACGLTYQASQVQLVMLEDELERGARGAHQARQSKAAKLIIIRIIS